MKSLAIKFNLAKQNLVSSLEKLIKDERGDDGGVLKGIIWTAIIILAIIGLTTTINTVFTSSGTTFQTWVSTTLSKVFK